LVAGDLMIIRPMTEKDNGEVISILNSTPEFNPMDMATAIEVIEDYLQDPEHSGYHTLVAEIDSKIAGYVCYGHNNMTESTWDIYWIAVSRNIQGKGVGRQLMAAAENNIQSAGGKLIILETSSTPIYDKTNHFYVSLNYIQDCRIKDFYSPGDDQIIYEKRFR
jgi:ribosomal protein S18 acetylase RimI-like enzyme